MPSVAEIVSYANTQLRVSECQDWPNALNGLQIENSGRVTKIGAAVDASTETLKAAVDRGLDLMIVHHGLFWGGLSAVSGPLYRILKLAFAHDIALYSVHLPLDVHPTLGNNAQLAATLGLQNTERFLEGKGELVGLKTKSRTHRDVLLQKLQQSLGGPARMFADGPPETATIGVITGAAGSEIAAVAREGVDTFITGEAPHWAAIAAKELGINLLLGGHYATETFGVKALAAHLADRFHLSWEFIDQPTGL